MRPTIENIRGVGDYAVVYKWNLEFVIFPNVGGRKPSIDDLNWRCESVDLPQLTGQSIEVNVRGHKIKVPGVYGYAGTIPMVFTETVDNKISQFLHDWREGCWKAKTGVQLAKKDVEAVIRIVRLDRQDNPIWVYKLTGCYLEDATTGTLDSTSEVFKPNFTISYDYFEDGLPGTL